MKPSPPFLNTFKFQEVARQGSLAAPVVASLSEALGSAALAALFAATAAASASRDPREGKAAARNGTSAPGSAAAALGAFASALAALAGALGADRAAAQRAAGHVRRPKLGWDRFEALPAAASLGG